MKWNQPRGLRFGAALLAVGLGLLALAAPAQATPKLREKLQPLAKSIVSILDQESQTAVAFADIPADPNYSMNSGPGLQKILADEVNSLKPNCVQTKATVVVYGRYAPIDQEDPTKQYEKRVIKVTLSVRGKGDRSLQELSAIIDSNEDIAHVGQVTGKLPTNANPQDLNDYIKNNMDKPKVEVAGTKIFNSPESPYAIELLVKGEYDNAFVPRGASKKDGLAFVDIKQKEVYKIKVHNNSKYEAAIAVSIDGLDMFSFSDDIDPKTYRSKFSHLIIPAYQSTIVHGWFKTADKSRADNVLNFLVTAYGQGASTKGKQAKGTVGVIEVSFAAAWTDQPPHDEKGSRSASGNETGFGPPEKVGFTPVRRTIGNVREIICVRYTR